MYPTRTGPDRLPTDVRTDPPALLAQFVAVLAVPDLLLLASYPAVALVALAALVVAAAVAATGASGRDLPRSHCSTSAADRRRKTLRSRRSTAAD